MSLFGLITSFMKNLKPAKEIAGVYYIIQHVLYDELQEIESALMSLRQEPIVDYSVNSELKKLAFYGPGPKAAIPTITTEPGGKVLCFL